MAKQPRKELLNWSIDTRSDRIKQAAKGVIDPRGLSIKPTVLKKK